MKKWLPFVMLTMISFPGCDSSTTTSPMGLERSWEVVRIELQSGAVLDVPDPSRFTLRFDPDGDLSVRADCNTCFGTYQINGAQIQVSLLGCTRAFCGEESLDVAFLQVLGGQATYELSDGTPARLTLRFPEGSLGLVAVP